MPTQYEEFFLRHPSQDNYRLLRVYAWYRALLSCVLLALFVVDVTSNVLGRTHPELYGYTISIYSLISALMLGAVLLIRREPVSGQIFSICLVDVIFLTIIMYCSGGISTGLGSLIFITVAASSIFLQGQIATLLAALACIAIFIESLASGYWGQIKINPVAVALLGGLLFVTSILFQYLARRIQASQQSAIEQAEQAAILQQLNEMIVQRMNTGIVAIDKDGSILLYNESAARLLNFPLRFDLRDRMHFSRNPSAQVLLEQWVENPLKRPPVLTMEDGGLEIQLNFARMDNGDNDLVLVFAEDTRKVSQQAQQMKLASLGHLTASIAHEVRNPLGAISHAAQLLAESENLSDADKRLSTIIQNHSLRVNGIIENVLRLSRREASNPEKCDLCEWVKYFSKQHVQTYDQAVDIILELPNHPLPIYFDLSQLEQILANLCSNGLRYSKKNTGEMKIRLHAYMHEALGTPYLEVIDFGVGLSQEQYQQVFEPFFTTETKGTGLGLYIARELCLANQASLEYRRTNEGLSCFQIGFSHSNRVIA